MNEPAPDASASRSPDGGAVPEGAVRGGAAKVRFHLPPGGPYLMAHAAGCLPVGARAAIERDVFAPWSELAGDAWGRWLETIDGFRGQLAALLGGAADEWCPQPSVSAGVYAALSGVRFAPGREVVLVSRDAFPTIGYAVGGLERLGLRLEFVEGDPALIESWARIGDSDVAAALPMHVHSNTGALSPVREIAAMAREAGVLSLVDIAQSAGVLPIDVAAWGVDAAVGSSLKWLCGGSGAGFLWASPALCARAEPGPRGWFSHENPFEMDIARFAYAADARRFWGGTPSVAPFAIAREGLRTVAAIGVEPIRAHNLALIARLMRLAPRRFADDFDPAARGGTLCLALGPDVEARLAAAGVRVDRRGEALRLSFAIWNDEADVDLVAELLQGEPAR